MPTYEYRCKACGHGWERFQSMTAAPEKVCPKCGKRQAERLIGIGAAVVFKGSGFYQTDYRSESYKKAAAADKPGGAGGGGESGAGGAAKPAESSKPAESAKPAASEPTKAARADKPDKPAKPGKGGRAKP